MSKPFSFRDGERATTGARSAAGGTGGAEELAVLGRARQAWQQETVPVPVRQRLLARALEEARERPVGAVSAGPFVPVQHGGGAAAARIVLALALAASMLVGVRGLWRSLADPAAEAGRSGKSPAAGGLGPSLLRHPFFRAPARVLPAGAMLAASVDVLPEGVFSEQGRAWQVRRWNDLSSPPSEPAAYDFAEGALCVGLGPGERVVGGWPWVAPGAQAPPAVPLQAGVPHRLTFQAWAREPLPGAFLIAVGHSELPFSARGGAHVALSERPQSFAVDFVLDQDDPSVGVAFLVTGAGEGRTRVCLKDVRLTSGGGEGPR